MYRTFLAGSPCEKIVSFFLNSATFRDTPVVSRKSCKSKLTFFGEVGLVFAAVACAILKPSLYFRSSVSQRQDVLTQGLVQVMPQAFLPVLQPAEECSRLPQWEPARNVSSRFASQLLPAAA